MASMGMFTLLMAMLSGGASELLDFVPTEAYWKAKGVAVSTEQLLADASPAKGADATKLIIGLGAGTPAERAAAAQAIVKLGPAVLPQLEKAKGDPDLEIATRVGALIRQIKMSHKANGVRALMAIRTLGERKKPEALAGLRALVGSKEPFVAEYAARAVAQIEGRPAPARQVPADGFKADLGLMPANLGALAQVSGMSGGRVSIEDALKTLPPGEEAKQAVEQMTAALITAADQMGNVRMDGVTIGVSDDVGDKTGFVAIVARAQFDAGAVGAMMANFNVPSRNVDGVDVFSAERQMALFFQSDERAILLVGPNQEVLPVKELIAASRQEKAGAIANAALAKLVAGIDPKAVGWAVVTVNDHYRKAPILSAFDQVVLTITHGGELTRFAVKADGKDAKAVEAAVAQVEAGVTQAQQELPKVVQMMPAMKPIADFVQSVKVEANGASAGMTAELKGEPSVLLMGPAMMFGVSVRPADPPVQAPPPVIERVQPDVGPNK